MNKLKVIADAGVIVGLILKRDQWHSWTLDAARDLTGPYLTCEAVIAEAAFLLRDSPGGEQSVLDFVEKGMLSIDFSLTDNLGQVKSLMKKYADVPMSLADACVVRMSEAVDNCLVFTIDADFRIYRRHGRQQIPLVIPDSV